MSNYDVQMLAKMAGVSKQSVYSLINRNQALVKHNSTKINRKVYYNQIVADYVLSYYGKVDAASIDETILEEDKAPSENQVHESAVEVIEALRSQIAMLEAEVNDLRAQLERESAHCSELIRQNSIAWVTINKEKEEKALMLPAPRKQVSVAVHDFFVQLIHGKKMEQSRIEAAAKGEENEGKKSY